MIIHSKAFARPVTAYAELFKLPDNNSAVFLFPQMAVFKKLFPADLVFVDVSFGEIVNDFYFSGD